MLSTRAVYCEQGGPKGAIAAVAAAAGGSAALTPVAGLIRITAAT